MLSFLDTRNKTAVYTRWEKKTCPSNAELVLSGKNGELLALNKDDIQ